MKKKKKFKKKKKKKNKQAYLNQYILYRCKFFIYLIKIRLFDKILGLDSF